ncbi:MAG: Ubiquinone biosynthesis O-methyltransferase, mitochondrial [Chroococcidiopsis sp. SAG 2025]|nr:Ubiquinone biosynthesis O-methyltransferase, mitochondrial [Chroococcidiopsis sp. SAG 2025]
MTDLSLRKGVERIDCVIYETENDSDIHRLLSPYSKQLRTYSDSITKLNQTEQKQYDQILLINVLEHVQEDQKALVNIRNIMKDEGKLIISVPNRSYKSVFSEDFHNYVGHVRDGYSYDDMEKLLNKVGLEIESFFNYGVVTKDYYYEFYSNLLLE